MLNHINPITIIKFRIIMREKEASQRNGKKQRLDKWLKLVCLYKTRSDSLAACEGRKVKINNLTAKPGKSVAAGDEITINKSGKYRIFEVLKVPVKSISKKEARECYKEVTPHAIPKEIEELVEFAQKSEPVFQTKYKGRPTKKERRNLVNFKTHNN